MTILIDPTTSSVSASQDTTFRVGAGSPVTISANALAGSENVDIEYSPDGSSTTWSVAYNFDSGEALVLSATGAQLILNGTGYYRVSKDATVSSCGVYLHSSFT